MQPKYEEKTFESYFNSELSLRTSIYFPFGQVQEGSIGADASGYSLDSFLWRCLGYPSFFHIPFKGVDLRLVADEMEAHLGREIKNIPKIKANLLFQYKRPELIASKLGLEWQHWHQKYFRYDIYQEQQELLAYLASTFGTQALVLYASPALEDVNDLIDAKQRECIIENTNFRPAAELTGHHRNTYIKAGTHSMAFSKPEQLEKYDLLTQLENLKEDQANENKKQANNEKQMIEFADTVRIIAKKNSTFGQAYSRELKTYIELKIDNSPLLFSMLSMKIFRELSGVQWLLALDTSNDTKK